MAVSEVLALGLVCWAATTIIVESEFFRPLRERLQDRRVKLVPTPAPPADTIEEAVAYAQSHRGYKNPTPQVSFWWDKAWYLSGCHWCCGTWVAFALVAFFDSPWDHWYGFIAGALLVKAIGHLVLELRPQAWMTIRSAKWVDSHGDKRF
jgi:hypothetical protein